MTGWNGLLGFTFMTLPANIASIPPFVFIAPSPLGERVGVRGDLGGNEGYFAVLLRSDYRETKNPKALDSDCV
jgi:hypothetical protein